MNSGRVYKRKKIPLPKFFFLPTNETVNLLHNKLQFHLWRWLPSLEELLFRKERRKERNGKIYLVEVVNPTT